MPGRGAKVCYVCNWIIVSDCMGGHQGLEIRDYTNAGGVAGVAVGRQW